MPHTKKTTPIFSNHIFPLLHTKMKFPFPFKSSDIQVTSSAAASSWTWPICAASPRTLSFRAAPIDNIYKTISSDDGEFAPDELLIPVSPPHQYLYQESAVISGLRSERLFFEPGTTSSILGEAKEQSVAMVVIDSRNPFADFRVSMEEMVEARGGGGVRDWDFMEELFEWYLRVNDESNHGCIVGAFVDLLFHLAIDVNSSSSTVSSSSSSSAVTKYSFSSPLSFSSSILENEDEMGARKNG